MSINPVALKLRAKKIGVLIQDARQTTGKSIEDCARVMGVSSSTYEAFELGEEAPSLPQLEVLAYWLEIHLDHFWGSRTLSEATTKLEALKLDQLFGLRQRIIGTLIRQARTEAGLSLDEAAGRLGITMDELESYELGERPIPLPILEALCAVLSRPVQDFLDRHGPVGDWLGQQQTNKVFRELPSELQDFVCKPVNRPYIEIAQRLSEMPVEKLRAVAEGLLAITL